MNERIQRIREQQALTILDGLDHLLAGQTELTFVRDRHGIVTVRESIDHRQTQRFVGVSISDAAAQYLQAQRAPETIRVRDTIPVIDNPSDTPTPTGSVSPIAE